MFLFRRSSILILFSFNASKHNFAWVAPTLRWYPRLFDNRDLIAALTVTLEVALVAVIVATVLGTLLGLGLTRLRNRKRGSAEALLLLPMVAPEIVMGISLLLFFGQLFNGQGSIQQISIAHITFCISYVAVVVRARGREPRPAARGGRPRPRGVGVGRVPVRDAAAAAAGDRRGRDADVRALVRRPDHHVVQRRASGRRRCRSTSTRRSGSA